MDRLRIAHMLDHASVGGGVLALDDTGFAKKDKHSVRRLGAAPRQGAFPPEGRKSLAALGREVLAELFRQVIDFMARGRDGPELTE
jgi:hypothetical protein